MKKRQKNDERKKNNSDESEKKKKKKDNDSDVEEKASSNDIEDSRSFFEKTVESNNELEKEFLVDSEQLCNNLTNEEYINKQNKSLLNIYIDQKKQEIDQPLNIADGSKNVQSAINISNNITVDPKSMSDHNGTFIDTFNNDNVYKELYSIVYDEKSSYICSSPSNTGSSKNLNIPKVSSKRCKEYFIEISPESNILPCKRLDIHFTNDGKWILNDTSLQKCHAYMRPSFSKIILPSWYATDEKKEKYLKNKKRTYCLYCNRYYTNKAMGLHFATKKSSKLWYNDHEYITETPG